VEGCHERIVGRVESIQPVEIHDIYGCRRNLCTLLHSFGPASIG
jgi:hypothetical protein